MRLSRDHCRSPRWRRRSRVRRIPCRTAASNVTCPASGGSCRGQCAAGSGSVNSTLVCAASRTNGAPADLAGGRAAQRREARDARFIIRSASASPGPGHWKEIRGREFTDMHGEHSPEELPGRPAKARIARDRSPPMPVEQQHQPGHPLGAAADAAGARPGTARGRFFRARAASATDCWKRRQRPSPVMASTEPEASPTSATLPRQTDFQPARAVTPPRCRLAGAADARRRCTSGKRGRASSRRRRWLARSARRRLIPSRDGRDVELAADRPSGSPCTRLQGEIA